MITARDVVGRRHAAGRAAETLRKGGLVVHPTETVYGIGGDGSAANNHLISRVKRRDAGQPLIVLTLGIDSLRSAFGPLDWPPAAESLTARFWPGPLTLVVRCDGAPEGLAGPGGGLAIRVSPEPVVRAVLEAFGGPMTSTSANLTGGAPARQSSSALQLFEEREDLADVGVPVVVIDAGPTKGRKPSTIVSLLESPPRLIREGPVSRMEIAALLPELS